MKKQLLLTLTFVVIVATPAFAQLASPNSSGVAAGHIHLNANDVEVQKKFWTDVGGKIVNREKLVMVQFPGIYVLLRKQDRSEEHTSELQSQSNLVCRLLLEKKK